MTGGVIGLFQRALAAEKEHGQYLLGLGLQQAIEFCSVKSKKGVL